MRECQSDSEDESVIKVCREGDMLMKGLVVSVSIIAWLLEICKFTCIRFLYDLRLMDPVSRGMCHRVQLFKTAGRGRGDEECGPG